MLNSLLFRKSRHKPNLQSTSKYRFSLDLGGKNGGVLSMHMQVILDSLFACPGSAPIGGGKKGEFRDWTNFQGTTSRQLDSGPVHTDIFESATFSFRIRLPSKRIRRIRQRIRIFLNPLSRVEKNKSATNPITCGQVNPDIFESDDVAKSCPVSY